MLQKLKGIINAAVTLVRGGKSNVSLHETGHYVVEQWRDGQLIDTWHAWNDVTNEGKNRTLDDTFNAGTAASSWFLGLIDNAGYSALAAGDIYSNINQIGNGWAEFANYTDAANSDSAVTRPAWGQGASSSQTVTNGSVVQFDIVSPGGTVKGMFICAGSDAQTKSDYTSTAGHNNVLWATALFAGGDKVVSNGDQLKCTLSVSM